MDQREEMQIRMLTDKEKATIFNSALFILYQQDGGKTFTVRKKGIDTGQFIEMLFRAVYAQTSIGEISQEEMAKAVMAVLPSFLTALGIKDRRDDIIAKQKQTIESLEYALTSLNKEKNI